MVVFESGTEDGVYRAIEKVEEGKTYWECSACSNRVAAIGKDGQDIPRAIQTTQFFVHIFNAHRTARKPTKEELKLPPNEPPTFTSIPPSHKRVCVKCRYSTPGQTPSAFNQHYIRAHLKRPGEVECPLCKEFYAWDASSFELSSSSVDALLFLETDPDLRDRLSKHIGENGFCLRDTRRKEDISARRENEDESNVPESSRGSGPVNANNTPWHPYARGVVFINFNPQTRTGTARSSRSSRGSVSHSTIEPAAITRSSPLVPSQHVHAQSIASCAHDNPICHPAQQHATFGSTSISGFVPIGRSCPPHQTFPPNFISQLRQPPAVLTSHLTGNAASSIDPRSNHLAPYATSISRDSHVTRPPGIFSIDSNRHHSRSRASTPVSLSDDPSQRGSHENLKASGEGSRQEHEKDIFALFTHEEEEDS